MTYRMEPDQQVQSPFFIFEMNNWLYIFTSYIYPVKASIT